MHFITTLITVNSAEAITKYLSRESAQLKKRVEKPLGVIESADSLVLEMETEMEFLCSGGNYLPALDDNFLADQVVMVPIVSFLLSFCFSGVFLGSPMFHPVFPPAVLGPCFSLA